MKVGIIGAGNVGTGLAKHLAPRGHSVMLSFNRCADQLKKSAAALGVQDGTVAEAVRFADVVVLATPWTATADALEQVGKTSERKILWDCTNALKPDLTGLTIGTTTSAGEEVAKLAPWARVVKAIPPFAEMLHSTSMLIGGNRTTTFICSDDDEAREVVGRLVDEIGSQPLDAGPLVNARYIEPACMLLIQLAYTRGYGARIGMSVMHETAGKAAQ
jgi:predicted dinucleotide-binding enzyme